MKPIEIGDYVKFEYPSNGEYDCVLRVTCIMGTGPEDLVFFHDGTHAEQKFLKTFTPVTSVRLFMKTS